MTPPGGPDGSRGNNLAADTAALIPPATLPPVEGPLNDDARSGLVELLRNVARTKGISFSEACELSWLDMYEDILANRASIYESQLRRHFLEVQAEAIRQNRWDLMAPSIPEDWTSEDDDVVTPRHLHLLDGGEA